MSDSRRGSHKARREMNASHQSQPARAMPAAEKAKGNTEKQ
jgi:hypothetical protein